MREQQSGPRLGPQQARVYLSIRTAIEQGQFRPGHVLGSQASLARHHGVALATLHQALRVLEQDGYVVRRHGVGTFVADAPPRPHAPLPALARFISQPFPSTTQAAEAALTLLAEQLGVRSAFLSRVVANQLLIVADYDQDGCGIRAGANFPLADAF